MIYYTKRDQVEAFHWKGEWADALSFGLNEDTAFVSDTKGLWIMDANGDWVPTPINHWVVRKGHHYTTLTNRMFHQKYEK